ncbi:hypothetical protein HPB51_007406 [Rhipicephalus microplus]|uniref:Uncharacterized protein n=1 Tax=Rhipicephalus microplus TaxID=6941 RepID=A0A9J6EZV1_RHIMP|nr:hypothetical protein HPB51_007406 [Rhipicephalus microplus]
MAEFISPNVTHNIIVVYTPSPQNARAYTLVQQLRLRDILYRVAVYPAPTNDTCKAAIRGIKLNLSNTQLRGLIITKRNHSALKVKRIKHTTAVTTLFQEMQVHNYVYCCASIVCARFCADTWKFVTTAAASATTQTFALILRQCGAGSVDSKPHPRTTDVRPTAPSAVERTRPPIRAENVNLKFCTSYTNDDADTVNAVVAAPDDRVEPGPVTPAPPRAPP